MIASVLALDTSTQIQSVVAVGHGGLVASSVREVGHRHAEHLGDQVRRVLAELGAERASMVVCGIGPGPFSGLRVGISFAQALALGWSSGGHSVTTGGLLSLDGAAAVAGAGEPGSALAVSSDARRRERYWARYGWHDEHGWTRSAGPLIAPAAEVLGWADPALRTEGLTEPGSCIAAGLATLAARGLGTSDVGSFEPDERTGDGSRATGVPAGVLLPCVPVYLRRPDAVPPADRVTT